jgi:hypothetical protein
MRHLLRRSMIGLVVACLPVREVIAQTPVAARASVGCTYATCALRIEPSAWSGPRLLRGQSGEDVGRLGFFGQGVDPLLQGPDSAANYARQYVHASKVSATLGLLGFAAYVVTAVRTDNFRDHLDDATFATAIGGGGLAIASLPYTLRAQRSLSRAVWWYNAALPR